MEWPAYVRIIHGRSRSGSRAESSSLIPLQAPHVDLSLPCCALLPLRFLATTLLRNKLHLGAYANGERPIVRRVSFVFGFNAFK